MLIVSKNWKAARNSNARWRLAGDVPRRRTREPCYGRATAHRAHGGRFGVHRRSHGVVVAGVLLALAPAAPRPAAASDLPAHHPLSAGLLTARPSASSREAPSSRVSRALRTGAGAAASRLGPRASVLGPEVQVSPANPFSYSTTAIAVDPTDPTILYASANNASSPHVVGFISGDDGASWGLTIPPRADSGPTAGTFFPAAVFDARGELYQAYMPYAISDGRLQSQHAVARSTNKGVTWEHAAVVEPPGSVPERPSITVDRGSGPFHNRLYVAYDTNPSPDASPIVVAHSD